MIIRLSWNVYRSLEKGAFFSFPIFRVTQIVCFFTFIFCPSSGKPLLWAANNIGSTYPPRKKNQRNNNSEKEKKRTPEAIANKFRLKGCWECHKESIFEKLTFYILPEGQERESLVYVDRQHIHSLGATTKKAQFLVVLFQDTLRMTTYNCEASVECVDHS